MWKGAGRAPSFASFSLAFALQLRKEHGKNLSQVKKNLSQVKKSVNQSTVYILPKHPHITKPSQTHTLIINTHIIYVCVCVCVQEVRKITINLKIFRP